MKNKTIPEVGKYYYFFDDGKTSPSRCFKAKVVRVVPYNEEVILKKYDYDLEADVPTSIQEIHKEEVDNHRQSENFIIIGRNTNGIKPGDPWLYAEETDFFVECEIPGYDKNTIWFARTVNGGWFSMDIQCSWQSGSLDVDNSIYEDIKKTYAEMNDDYDKYLKLNGELI